MAGTSKSTWDAEWRHHDISNPALAALSLYAVEAAASLLHHNGQVDAVALAAATGAAAAAWMSDRHFWLQVYLTVATVVSLAWILYAEHVSPFTAKALTAFAAGAVLLGLVYPLAAFIDRRDKRREDERFAAKAQKGAKAGDWVAVFEALGLPGVEFLEESEFRAGRTIALRLPAHGKYTFTRAAALADRLETLLDLPGRSVKFRAGETARSFFLDIHTRDVFAEDLPFEYERTETTVNEPFDIGLDVFGEEIDLLIREIRAAIFAPPGSGKSNLLNVLIARLLRCVDVVIWVIDFKHRLVKPWLEPWIEGRTQRPVLDWVATTPREARLMAQSLVKAIDHRSVTGVGSKITPSARQPAIILISDETASAVGLDAGPDARALAALLKDIIGRGRSEAVDAILTFLRPTVEMTGTSTFKNLSKLRITLPGLTPADAASATDSPGLAAEMAEIEHPGAMLVNKGRSFVRLGKSYLMEDADVPVVAEAYSRWRPGLEDDLEAELGDPYAQRWSLDRCGHLLPKERQLALGYNETAREAAAQVASPTAGSVALPSIPPPPKDAKPAYRTVDGRPLPRPLDPAAVEEMFAGLKDELADIGKHAPHRGRTRMIGLIFEAMPDGIKAGELTARLNQEGITCGRQAVHEWLRDEVSKGSIINENSLYYTNPNGA